MRTLALAIARFARGEYGPRGNIVVAVLSLVLGGFWASGGRTGLAVFFAVIAVANVGLAVLKWRRPDALRGRRRSHS